MYEDTREKEGKIRGKWKLTKVKYMTNTNITPIRMDLYLDYADIAIDAIAPFVISIKSKEVHNSFKEYFERLWKQAKN